MNRKDFFKMFGIGVAATVLPQVIPAAAPVPDSQLTNWIIPTADGYPLTHWLGTPCYRLPDVVRPELNIAALADGMVGIQNSHDMCVESMWMNTWDAKALLKMKFRGKEFLVDKETHRWGWHAGVAGYLWGMTIHPLLRIERGDIWFLSDTYEETPTFKPRYSALLQKLIIERAWEIGRK